MKTDSHFDVTSVNINCKHIYEDEIFDRQDTIFLSRIQRLQIFKCMPAVKNARSVKRRSEKCGNESLE